jgi:hypothetical protein
MRRFDRLAHILFGKIGDFGDHFAGRGILHRETRAGARASPFAVDIGGVTQKRVVVELQHWKASIFSLLVSRGGKLNAPRSPGFPWVWAHLCCVLARSHSQGQVSFKGARLAELARAESKTRVRPSSAFMAHRACRRWKSTATTSN